MFTDLFILTTEKVINDVVTDLLIFILTVIKFKIYFIVFQNNFVVVPK